MKFEQLKTNPKLMVRQSERYPSLHVVKYKRSVFFNGDWDDVTIEARGHVYTTDGRLVIRPFTKIFNRFENNTNIHDNELCLVVRKINGFMAAATYVAEVDEVVVSTTGSLDSPYVALAEKHITDQVKAGIKLATNSLGAGTFLFEICDGEDPHIIPEQAGAYLLGFRADADEGSYFSTPAIEHFLDSIAASVLEVKRPDWNVSTFAQAVDDISSDKTEGVVVYGQTSLTSLKMKSPYYLACKAAARKKDIMSLDKTRVDEEFYDLIDHLKSAGDHFSAMAEQQRLAYIREFLCEGGNT